MIKYYKTCIIINEAYDLDSIANIIEDLIINKSLKGFIFIINYDKIKFDINKFYKICKYINSLGFDINIFSTSLNLKTNMINNNMFSINLTNRLFDLNYIQQDKRFTKIFLDKLYKVFVINNNTIQIYNSINNNYKIDFV